MSRTISIGDIHGCLPALETLLAAIRPTAEDTVVALGDYVDRGPQTRQVIDRLIELAGQCRLIPLLGNHEEMMLQVIDGQSRLYVDWLLFGGEDTLRSYGTVLPEEVPAAHVDFLRNCPLIHETEYHFFVHGGYLADRPLDAQPRDVLLWDSIKKRLPGPHRSGKTAIVGHASQHGGEVCDLGYLKCIDTWCYGTGWLTALDVESGQVWQADKAGRARDE